MLCGEKVYGRHYCLAHAMVSDLCIVKTYYIWQAVDMQFVRNIFILHECHFDLPVILAKLIKSLFVKATGGPGSKIIIFDIL